MQVEIFTIADAGTEAGGKLNLLGSFDTIYAKELPAVWPLCSVIAKVRAFRGETEKHKFEIRMNDPQGRVFGEPFSGDLSFSFSPSVDFTTANLIMNYQGIIFPEYGKYTISLVIDGKILVTTPLLVQKPV